MSKGDKTKAIPVRISENWIERIDDVAKTTHLGSRSDLIKLCVTSFVEHFEKSNKTELPLDWNGMLKELDGRTHRYEKNKG